LDGLTAEQRRAVEAVRGPVCILAGAGSGKTTTITRRIANQVSSCAFAASQIMAVTFTDKAAGEMRARLERLGVQGVRARTFHAAALAQLRFLSEDPPQQILSSKAFAIRQIANALPKPYRFRAAADLAQEIEWAKNRRIDAATYEARVGDHQTPIPADLMARVYQRYERGKREQGLVDFEDLLELAIRMFQSDESVRERFAARYLAFTVDEYQDMNLLQETLLQEWLAGRDDLCVVGDDYQSIYSFTGATPQHLLEMPRRFPNTTVVRLEENFRSTPQILEVANRLVPKLGGAEKHLRAVRPDGPAPELNTFRTDRAESEFIVNRIRSLHGDGVVYEDMAILYRVNFRSEDYEEILAAQGIPYQVRDGAFLSRQTARQMLRMLASRGAATDVAAHVRRIADRAGYADEVPDGVGDQELTRQADLARFVRLAAEFDDGHRTVREFVHDVEARFGGDGGRGVNLLSYHRAKGLEFEAVFLPRLEDGELPFKRSKSPEALSEEQRLFYVGITRAKTHLAISWVSDGRRKQSPFVRDLIPPSARTSEAATAVPESGEADPLVARLKEWRLERSRSDAVPAYVVLHDSTLVDIANRQPATLAELEQVRGFGPSKLDRYGDGILAVVAAARDDCS